MSVHLAIREVSLGGIVTGGRESIENAFGGVLGGPPATGDSRLRRGTKLRRINRS